MKLKRKDTSQIDRISTIGVIDKLDEEDIKQPIFHMTATFGDDFDTKNHRNSVITDNMPQNNSPAQQIKIVNSTRNGRSIDFFEKYIQPHAKSQKVIKGNQVQPRKTENGNLTTKNKNTSPSKLDRSKSAANMKNSKRIRTSTKINYRQSRRSNSLLPRNSIKLVEGGKKKLEKDRKNKASKLALIDLKHANSSAFLRDLYEDEQDENSRGLESILIPIKKEEIKYCSRESAIKKEDNNPNIFFANLEKEKREEEFRLLGDDAVSDYSSGTKGNGKLNMGDWEKGILAHATPKCTPMKAGQNVPSFRGFKKK